MTNLELAVVSNGIEYSAEEAERIMNNLTIEKVQNFSPQITHFPGNWEFITWQKKLDWFTANVNFAIMINWFK